jgi:hypothetical protein
METMTETPKTPRKPRKTTAQGRNVQALENTVAELEKAGRLGPLDAARVQIALNLARMVDEFPENPTLWREYRTAEKALREESENYGDPFDELLRSLSATVGNETKQTKKDARA